MCIRDRYKVLGGYRDQIVTDMTIGIDKPELMAQEAKERVERDGFRILKMCIRDRCQYPLRLLAAMKA